MVISSDQSIRGSTYWTEVAEFPRYEINNRGQIRNKVTKHMKVYGIQRGYPTVWFYNNGKRYKRRVHRIVAMAFIPNDRNPLIYGLVHHKDGDKLNFDISNLEWVSAKQHNRGHRKKQTDRQVVKNMKKELESLENEKMVTSMEKASGPSKNNIPVPGEKK